MASDVAGGNVAGSGRLMDIAKGVRYLFFTGKGGSGKTSVSCAAALALADTGRRVLLVSTDPASNLAEVLECAPAAYDQGSDLSAFAPVNGAPNLVAVNIAPNAAAAAYRERVLAPLRADAATDSATLARLEEQLSGQCTVEVAAFDEFAFLLAGGHGSDFEHVVFDTAPTGHTLRLLSLPGAWSAYFNHNEGGASCIGPVSALKTQRARFDAALASLVSPELTAVVLVARPEARSLAETARTSGELDALGVANQHVVLNGVFEAAEMADTQAAAFHRRAESALAGMAASLRTRVAARFPLQPWNVMGVERLRLFMQPAAAHDVAAATNTVEPHEDVEEETLPPLKALVDTVATWQRGLVMLMGKGGVGKTTIAAALAVELASRGRPVHLSTTDPAAHLTQTLAAAATLPNLQVSCIDPVKETQEYVERVVASKGALAPEAKALLLEDLDSPCTEELAVFDAFTALLARTEDTLVVLDTAPTGHTVQLMDQSGAYDRDVLRTLEAARAGTVGGGAAGAAPSARLTPLTLMQDRTRTALWLVTLPEATPISEAAELQADLRRVGIEPAGWVVNQCLQACAQTVAGGDDAAVGHSANPVLRGRCASERRQLARLRCDIAPAMVVGVPWRPHEPEGVAELRALLGAGETAAVAPAPALERLQTIHDPEAFEAEAGLSLRGSLVVLFGAPRHAQNRELEALLRWAAAQTPAAAFRLVDGADDDLADMMMDLGVVNVPAVHVYKQGGALAATATTLQAAAAALSSHLNIAVEQWPGAPLEVRDVVLQQPIRAHMIKPNDLREVQNAAGIEAACCAPGGGG